MSTIKVTIEHVIGESTETVSFSSDGPYDESQELLGFVAGHAIRAMVAQQNCGCPPLFWLGFLREVGHSEMGGEWVQILAAKVEEWWEKSGDGEHVFEDEMMDLFQT